jgi:hypothetical protein
VLHRAQSIGASGERFLVLTDQQIRFGLLERATESAAVNVAVLVLVKQI